MLELLGSEAQACNVPLQVMDCAGGCQDYGAARSEGEADESLAGHFEIGFAVGSDFHDAACA